LALGAQRGGRTWRFDVVALDDIALGDIAFHYIVFDDIEFDDITFVDRGCWCLSSSLDARPRSLA
jgi:hypothetical protein